jgi:hypothetical protein
LYAGSVALTAVRAGRKGARRPTLCDGLTDLDAIGLPGTDKTYKTQRHRGSGLLVGCELHVASCQKIGSSIQTASREQRLCVFVSLRTLFKTAKTGSRQAFPAAASRFCANFASPDSGNRFTTSRRMRSLVFRSPSFSS